MSINDNLKNDIIFFKNEILSDIKNIQTKLADKVSQIDEVILQQNAKIENRLKEMYSKFDTLTNQFQEKKNGDNIENLVGPLEKKLDESISKLEIQLNLLEKDYSNSCFKYDKIFSNNLNVPGLIGNCCPYDSLRQFLEYVNLKITELIRTRDKQNFDFKKYREKLDLMINNNKNQFDAAQNRLNEFCKNGFKQCENTCNEKLDLFEKRIEALRIENGEFSFELKQRSEELKVEWEKMDNYEKNLNKRYDEELQKYKKIVDNISKKVNKNNEQFNLIKIRFKELSDFVKDIRFRKNLNDINNAFHEKKQLEMNNKKYSNKKLKIQNEKKDENEDKDKGKVEDIFEPFDYYAHFERAHLFKEEEYSKENKNIDNNIIQKDNNYGNNSYILKNNNGSNISILKDNNSENNKINIKEKNNINEEKNNININKIINNSFIFENKNNIIENEIKENQMNNNSKKIENNNKMKIDNFINDDNNNKKSLYIINNNYEPEIKQNYIIYNNSTNNINENRNIINNDNKIKDFKKNSKNIKSEKINTQIINNDLNIINDNNIKINNYNEKVKFISPDNKKSKKINDVMLNAKFKINEKNNIKTNLSEAYILMKRKNAEDNKIKTLYGGKSEYKFQQISPSSLKHNIQHSRNINNLNELNILSNRVLTKRNIEDIYYSQLRKNKLSQIILTPKNYIRPSNSQDNIYFNKTLNKKKFPLLYYDAKIFNSSLNDKYMLMSYHNNSNRNYFSNFLNNLEK